MVLNEANQLEPNGSLIIAKWEEERIASADEQEAWTCESVSQSDERDADACI